MERQPITLPSHEETAMAGVPLLQVDPEVKRKWRSYADIRLVMTELAVLPGAKRNSLHYLLRDLTLWLLRRSWLQKRSFT